MYEGFYILVLPEVLGGYHNFGIFEALFYVLRGPRGMLT